MRIIGWSSDVCSSDLSVGVPYFEATFVPLMVPTILALGVGPMLAWKRGDLATALGRLWIAALAAAGIGLSVMYLRGAPVGAALGFGLAVWQLGRASCRERVCQYV